MKRSVGHALERPKCRVVLDPSERRVARKESHADSSLDRLLDVAEHIERRWSVFEKKKETKNFQGTLFDENVSEMHKPGFTDVDCDSGADDAYSCLGIVLQSAGECILMTVSRLLTRAWCSIAFCAVVSYALAVSAEVYNETYRPQFHFTYKVGWLSDINGLFYYQGEYHLFTQHCPEGPALNYPNTHWGHAVSRDLIHWKELPPALEPDEYGPTFSGSSVVDWNNTSGLQTGDELPIVAFYTGASYILPSNKDGVQCMAYSNDKGRTWIKYKKNPVLGPITHYNRDPKVFWHKPSQKWIMAITLSCASHWLEGDYRYALFSSPNLKEWTPESRFDMKTGVDCPDMFELPVDGDADNPRWVFWAGDGTYMIGHFDGRTFTREGDIQKPFIDWLHDGANGYAAQTFSNVPDSDGRRIQIAWLRHGSFPGMEFNQQTLFPCEMTLQTTPDGIKLHRNPVKEIEKLHTQVREWKDTVVAPASNILSEIKGRLFDLCADLTVGNEVNNVVLQIRGEELRYDPGKRRLHFKGQSIPAGNPDRTIRLQILIDRTSIEIFADHGRTSMSFSLAPETQAVPFVLEVDRGELEVNSLHVWQLKSIWR